ncbi:MAG TPA: hypothetical protein ENI20_17785 [Bacteroides sp.]|nr:hypothetical protein [Bacteroides sp.]
MNKWFKEIEDLLRNGVSEETHLFANKYAIRARGFIDKAMKGIDKEAGETREMASSFFRLLEHKLDLNERSDPPTKEEVKAAVEQLKDVGRYSVFITAVVLPGGVVSLVGLEMLARNYGIKFSFIPSAFRKENKTEEKDPKITSIELPEDRFREKDNEGYRE